MVKNFKSRLIYFHERRVKINPESEISCHITLTSVISLFHTRYLYYCSLDGWRGGWVDGRLDGGMDGWVGGWMDGWRGGWDDGWMGG